MTAFSVIFIAFFLSFFAQLVAGSNSNVTCIVVTLYDTFGDGWSDVKWTLDSPNSDEVIQLAPNCTVNPVYRRICGEDGTYYMLVTDDELPDNSWEIIWTVEVEKTMELYTGGFNSTMVFTYKNNDWSLFYSHNLWSNTLNYTACGSSDYVEDGSCYAEEETDHDRHHHQKPEVHQVEEVENKTTFSRPSKVDKHPTASPIHKKLIGKSTNKDRILVDNKLLKNSIDDNDEIKSPTADAVRKPSFWESKVKAIQRKKDNFNKLFGGSNGGGAESEEGNETDIDWDLDIDFENDTAGFEGFLKKIIKKRISIGNGLPEIQELLSNYSVTLSANMTDEDFDKLDLSKLIKEKKKSIISQKKINVKPDPTAFPTLMPTNATYNATYNDEEGGERKANSRKKNWLLNGKTSNKNKNGGIGGGLGGENEEEEGLWPTYQPTLMPNNATWTPTESPTSEPKENAGEHHEHNKFSPKPKKPTKVGEALSSSELKVYMYDTSGEGWFLDNYEGTSFYISDESKKYLIAYGSLENGTYSGYCEYCFGEGSYIFRVSASSRNDATWSFCHTNGSYAEQLYFHIKDGECVPDALVNVDMICEHSYSSVVTVNGKLTLVGIPSEIFNSKEASVLANSLAYTVDGWDAENIEVAAAVLNVRSITTRRSLSAFAFDVTFEVSFVPEIAYEFDGTSYSGVEDLVAELAEVLESAADSGKFVSTVKSFAKDAHVRHLDSLDKVLLASLSLADITYVGTKTLASVELIESSSTTSGSSSTSTSSSFSSEGSVDMSMYHVVFFGAVLSVGFLAFIGVLVHTFSSRQEEAEMSKYVVPSDIDLSITNHYNNNNINNLGNARTTVVI